MEIDFIVWLNANEADGKPFQTILAESSFKDKLLMHMGK